MNKKFESENIIYINITEDLVDEYLPMVNDKEIQKMISKVDRTYTKEEEIDWIKETLESGDYQFSMLEKDSNKFIGNVSLMDVENNSAEVGICITMSMQDKHYGTEALNRIIEYGFNDLNLENLTAGVFSINPRSMHLVEKVGFKKVSVEENYKISDGVGVSLINFILERSV